MEISDDKDKAEHLSQFFRSVVTSEPAFFPPFCEDDETPTLEAVFFTEAIVRNELLNLKESTSPGPDAIPAKLLKELAPEMSKPLAVIFQTSFLTGCLPSDWKPANITPLFKGGSRASANNYRPVSLTSICYISMEKIHKKALMQFLEQHHLLSDVQHGFRSGRPCLTNLLFTLERWTKARDEGNVVHAIYIDFKKALDSVPHQRLLHKLRNAGIRGRLLVWIQSFLSERSQRVQVGRQQSSEVVVDSPTASHETSREAPPGEPNIALLSLPVHNLHFRNELFRRLDNVPVVAAPATADKKAFMKNRWSQLRDTVQSTTLAVLGRARRPHQDWFNDNDAAIGNLLVEKNSLHKAYVDRPADDNRTAFYGNRCLVQRRLRKMRDAWTARKAEEIQRHADRNEWKNFFCTIKVLYGPPTKVTAFLLSANDSTLLTKKT
ncbi:hypothetical protein SprV_0902673700 [Sparganum proliferum]